MNKNFWNNIYKTKTEKEVSWFQEIPTKSLELIKLVNPATDISIIDIGGGESRLVDSLIELKYSDVTVLDISDVSLEKVKLRLQNNNVKLIHTDIVQFAPFKKYDLWHDRAAFHFLTGPADIKKYIQIASSAIKTGGHIVLSTFSKTGPDKCSGLPITKYSHQELIDLFSNDFTNLNYIYETHETPWSSKQDFVYCTFIKN
jgi:2-polyprenyl-3-methyl-5-hydroxy-6-metoxy-1,4-benzoquinol methylase